MFNLIKEILSYPFLARAVVSGILIALCSALLGVSLVLKRYAMIGDGLSHVSFGALSLAMFFGWAPLSFSLPVVMLASFLLLRLSDKTSIRGDSALAMISSSALAIGVIAVSWGRGMSTDVCNYMFGTILATSVRDVKITLVLAAVVISLFIIFYQRLFAITFDENFARASGSPAGYYNMLLAALTSVTIVIGMRIMGALLISALIIFPALASMRVFKSFKAVVISSAVISVVSFSAGFLASFVLQTPSGASIVVVNLIIFILMSVIGQVLPYLKPKPKLAKTSLLSLTLLALFTMFSLGLVACGREGSVEPGLIQPDRTQTDQSQQVQEYDDLINLIENPTEAPELKKFEPQKLPQPAEGEEIFIDEKMYIGWILDIYTNTQDYEGKAVRIRGMFQTYEQAGLDHYVVYRFGPGCCGNDGGMCGFEITLPEGVKPETDQWIEVRGVLERYKADDGLIYLRIATSELSLLDQAENPYATHF